MPINLGSSRGYYFQFSDQNVLVLNKEQFLLLFYMCFHCYYCYYYYHHYYDSYYYQQHYLLFPLPEVLFNFFSATWTLLEFCPSLKVHPNVILLGSHLRVSSSRCDIKQSISMFLLSKLRLQNIIYFLLYTAVLKSLLDEMVF